VASKFAELCEEVRGLRRDVEEIREMLIPEVSPSEGERRAVAGGRKEFARGKVERWGDVRKRVSEL
jgi:hypothetical protein